MGFIDMPLFYPTLRSDAFLVWNMCFTPLKSEQLSERKFECVMCVFFTMCELESPSART